jgi:hypothetical protein
VIANRLGRSELYRRNLSEPEIVTFDELLARAQRHVTLAERDADDRSARYTGTTIAFAQLPASE